MSQSKVIMVTGGAGFIGSWICRRLVEEGYTVSCVDDFSGGSQDNVEDLLNCSNFFCYRVDMCQEHDVIDAFNTIRPDIVYHLAANAREGASFFQPISVVRRNTLAYTNVLTHSILHEVERIILFSSMAVYGSQMPPFTEFMQRKPVDIYGLQKAGMESMTEMLAGCHDLDYVIIRPHNVYGPGQALSDIHRNVLGIWMNKIMLGQPVTIYGDGQQVRAMSYIEDSLPAYIKAGLEPMNHQRIFNIGGDDPKSILELALVTIAAMGQDPNIYPLDYIDPRHKEVHNAYCSHLLAKQVFNFSNKTSLKDGIQAMADWAMKKGPQKWNTVDKLEITNHLTPQMWINGGQP